MYSVIFYILLAVIIISAMGIAFGRNKAYSLLSLFMLLITASGIHTVLNSELFGLINILFITGISALLIILFPKIKSEIEDVSLSKSNFFVIILIGLLTALISSIVSSTRWPAAEINYEMNSFILIFTKYLPLIILITAAASVILSTLSSLIRKGRAENA